MNANHKNDPGADVLRAGIIGSGESLTLVAEAATACPRLELVGQAGMPQAAACADVPWFDDSRVLATQSDVRALLLATAPRRAVGLGALAGEFGLPCWQLPPLARHFGEATETAARVRRDGDFLRVASWWEHVVDHAWNELAWPDQFDTRFSEIIVSAPGPGMDSWAAILNDAGGGALMHAGYNMLEALVALRGLPDSVTAIIGNYRGGNGPSRETEDTATALLRYPGGGSAAVRVTWDLPPTSQQLTHYSATHRLNLSDEELVLADVAGDIQDRQPLPGDYLVRELSRFVEMVRNNTRDRALLPLERHLSVCALLETIYLAARTGHPESPRKLYEAQRWPGPHS